MALDSTIGGAGAESYVAVATADTYHSLRGNSAWSSLSASQKEVALRKATAYIDAFYRFTGQKVSDTQALQWPRYDVEVDGFNLSSTVLPKRLTDATCELALKASAEELVPDLETQIVTAESVGPLSVSYSASQRNGGRKTFDFVDTLLSTLVMGGGRSSVPLVRA